LLVGLDPRGRLTITVVNERYIPGAPGKVP
jgi:hypothetical protein